MIVTIDEMRKALKKYCDDCKSCARCNLLKCFGYEKAEDLEFGGCQFDYWMKDTIEQAYNHLKNIALDTGCNKEHTIRYNKHATICAKLTEIYKAKNTDYGNSFGDTFKKLGIISAITRMSDKMNRLETLAVNHDTKVKDEKIEDTLMDMANYAIMTLIELGYEPEN